MANNRIQVKRTSTTGRTANVTNSGNSQYINAGELALNMADGILYSSNGSALIEIGSNTTTQRITNSLNLDNNKPITFKTVNTAASASFIQQNDDNFVFYTTNTTYGQRAVWSIFANNNTANLKFAVQTTFNGNVDLNVVAVFANGSPGTAGQLLATNGTSTYWVTPGAASVNTAAQFIWTNTHTFQSNVSFTGNGIGITTNTGAIYLGGIADANWKIGRNTGSVTKWRYTNNSIDIITANSNLEGFVIGLVSNNSYFETGYLGTYIASNVTIGNSTSNSTINSTAFSGTSNNATNLGGTSAAGYQTTAGLSANVATLTSNNASNLGGQLPAFYTNATNITTGTLPYAQIPANVINTTAAFTRTGITTFSANVVLGSSGLSANGSFGTDTHVLHSNGTAAYWAADDQGVTSVATGNGMTGGTISTTGTVSVLANTGIVANATGTFVNASYIATITANNATFINGNNVLTVMESLRANRALHGGGTITVDGSGNILWGARFIVISNGRGTHFSTEGFFNISCPTSGTITGVGGAANKTATAAGIPLAAWEALYYILPIGSNSGSLAANFRVVSYTSDVEIPSNWLLICAQNDDNANYYFNNGVILKIGQSYVGGSHTSTTIGSNTFTVGTGTYFVAGGNVGIGNTTPNAKLQVTGTANVSGLTTFGANVSVVDSTLSVGNSTVNAVTNATAVTAHIQHASRPTLGFNYTIANTVNSLIVGPYAVNTGFTLTVESGARLVIV